MRCSPMMIKSTGICCSVGYSAPAAMAAIRAGMDHFRETEFVDDRGKALLGAQLYKKEIWGPDRMFWMVSHVIDECLANNKLPADKLGIILVLPEKSRPGLNPQWLERVYDKVKATYHNKIAVLYSGKAGTVQAIEQADKMFNQSDELLAVLIASVDSYFTSQTINHYLINGRILTETNSDGFLPGEAASAILLQRYTANAQPGLAILGYGISYEEAHILQNEKKMRAVGLSTAINHALERADCLLSQTQFRMSDISGESFYFREAGLALTRCMDKKVPNYPHLTLATKIGEVGAASGISMLVYLHHMMGRTNKSGERGLLHFSADSGERAALIVQYNS